MPLASSSSTQIRYAKETVFGTIPAAGTQDLRVTGESLDYTLSKESSKEINATRTVSSMIPTTASASGGLQAELSYNEYDDLMEATLQSTWVAYGTNGVAAAASSVAYTATTLTASVATATTDSWALLKKGQWFNVSHAANANNGKLFRVSTTVAPTTTVITLDANTPAVVAASSAGCSVRTSRLTHGITQSSFSIERQSTDIGQFMAYKGMTPSKLSVKVASAALSTLSFDFMGKDVVRGATTQLLGTVGASTTFDIQSGVSNGASVVWENGAPIIGTYIKSIDLSFDNSLRVQEALGTLGAVAIGSGTINITASTSIYFADGSLFDRFKSNTNSSLIFSSLDAAGNGYVFTLPVANITTWKTSAGGKDSDMMVDVQFTGLRDASNSDATLQKAIFIDRVGVAVV